MNKLLKYLLIAVGGVVVVLIALAAYLAATFNPNDYKPQIVQLVKEKLDRTLKIDGDIKLTFYPALGVDLGRLWLSERASNKEFAAVDAAQASLQLLPLLSRDVVVSQIEVRGLRANLVKHKNGSTNVDDLMAGAAGAAAEAKPGGEAKPTEEPVRFDIDHVLIEDANLSYVDEASGAKYAVNKLNLKTGRIAVGTPSDIELALNLGASKPKLNLDVSVKARLAFAPGERRFKADGMDIKIKGEAAGMHLTALGIKGELTGDAKAIKSSDLALNLDAKQGDNLIKDKLASPIAFVFGTQTVELSKLVANLGLSDAKSVRAPMAIDLTGSAHANLQKQNASLNFSAKLDESTITGKAGLARFGPPSYLFDVNVDKLDVDRYTGANKREAKGGAENSAKSKPEQELDFSALKGLQASGSVRIGSLKFANIKAQNVRLDVKAGGGRLDVNPLSAALYQGTLKGNVSLVAAATPQIALKQDLTGISIGPLLKDAIDKDLLEGKGTVTLAVSGQGATVSAIKKALNGSAALRLSDGALKGINIGAQIRNAEARLGTLKGETTATPSATEKTDFTELKASFAIKNGIAHNSDLMLKSPLLRLGGEGNINLGADSMDYLAKATLVATAAGQGGKGVSQLKGVTIPVRISGPFSALSYKLDFNAMIKGAAQQKIEEKKEELKAKVQDRLKDQLKGLFGR